MATVLRKWSYRYQALYDTISGLAALSVGGEGIRQLAIAKLNYSFRYYRSFYAGGSLQVIHVEK